MFVITDGAPFQITASSDCTRFSFARTPLLIRTDDSVFNLVKKITVFLFSVDADRKTPECFRPFLTLRVVQGADRLRSFHVPL
ncbi:hypothetical protein NQ318_000259 [Aromia moschata]|uniref:Uncharacterized protein n=1 Tax=Aromia moschata TaxID=1265417 RepID=A0AAV8YUQ0_9CUCU|nr:hypothetical protein NQ318_000259 [Aromia moschata]